MKKGQYVCNVDKEAVVPLQMPQMNFEADDEVKTSSQEQMATDNEQDEVEPLVAPKLDFKEGDKCKLK